MHNYEQEERKIWAAKVMHKRENQDLGQIQ